jgi:hypothetical protein
MSRYLTIATKANPTGTTAAPNRPSTERAFLKQMPVSELVVMVQGIRQLQSAGRA